MNRRAFILLAFLAVIFPWRDASASQITTAASTSPPGHAWFLAELPRQRSAVVHIPPRTQSGDGLSHGAADGTLRSARLLDSLPVAIAAMEDAVYLVFEDAAPGFPNLFRRVGSFRAVHSGVADLWATSPPDRLETMPNLPGEGRLLSLAGTSRGLAALLAIPFSDRSQRLTLLLLIDDRWREVTLPDSAQSYAASPFVESDSATPSNTTFRVESGGPGPRVTAVNINGEVRSWCVQEGFTIPEGDDPTRRTMRIPSPRLQRRSRTDESEASNAPADRRRDPPESRAKSPTINPIWTEERDLLPVVGPASASDIELFSIAAQRIAVIRNSDGETVVLSRRSGAWLELARVPSVGAAFAAVPLEASARVVLLWKPPDATSKSAAAGKMEMREVSALTGRILYAGPSIASSPITVSDYRLIILTLFTATSLVLAFILRAEVKDEPINLPEGLALAEPARRAFAAVCDFLIWFAVASHFFGLSPIEAISPGAILSGAGLWSLAGGLALAAIAGTLLETFTGRSLGKLLVGCRVVRLRKHDGIIEETTPPLAASLLRNFLKWMLPPVGALLLADPELRHPGDRLARTLVVIDVDPEDDIDQ